MLKTIWLNIKILKERHSFCPLLSSSWYKCWFNMYCCHQLVIASSVPGTCENNMHWFSRKHKNRHYRTHMPYAHLKIQWFTWSKRWAYHYHESRNHLWSWGHSTYWSRRSSGVIALGRPLFSRMGGGRVSSLLDLLPLNIIGLCLSWYSPVAGDRREWSYLL